MNASRKERGHNRLYLIFFVSFVFVTVALWTSTLLVCGAGGTAGQWGAEGGPAGPGASGSGVDVEGDGGRASPGSGYGRDRDAGPGGKDGCDALRHEARHPWPSSPSTKLGSPLVKIGCSFVDDARSLFLSEMDAFLRVYKNRPIKRNMCGMRVNHSYAIWIAVRQLRPEAIIESGVNAGHSTYIFRNAAPDAKIYCIDPRTEPLCREGKRWIDSKNATYFTGKNFQDFQDVDWGSMIARGELDPSKTLVFLDDHTHVFRRFSTLMRHGFRHVILEDNYRPGEGDTPADKDGWCAKQMLARTDLDSEFLYRTLKSYAEFPPLVPPEIARSERNVKKPKKPKYLHLNDSLADVVEPLLRPDVDGNIEDAALYERIAKTLGVDPKLGNNHDYLELMMYQQIAYFEVLPLAPHLAREENWK